MKARRALLSVLLAFILSGCGPAGQEELHQWMADQRANARPGVKPLEEPKKFVPESYTQGDATEPFNALRLTQILQRDSGQTASNSALVAPEMARRKEPLEVFALESIAMVGSLNKEDTPTALLRIDNLIYQVKIGNYLGKNYGKIVKITESSIQLREIVQDTTGDWVERSASLDLQEGKK
ncbi:pilus assembly protein PilP [Verminephrobacter aporrectodeae]|uniref:pilus assembly protein PilP n=1 Tax=Verminephrobacter aporrectodeae TaxID=1110389 RepID=UPI000496402E|nr:pilus assembly protein PilP [Verminephrobacter aporrectodeae]MCW5256942.1 pilus assembly protein PilP [Verminephrobacter aporrectodeae subsp. tuberculatae]MCW8163427.1 pilus assembly protein PilP [Verminephrobacter aporrectodeae subsp. tuberculatae]MCW8167656.1 pilus assembly protein PilP [Verminephrobacter aporrectodeae subsp. tuberculatae]MCW8173979.1 pilus assembly protein PilP [Verminephrobacter aporrectodeae subsp. tuberculatae]MCW8202022.1 pilus assembly protein PilP [Verminephrobacte